MTEKTQTEAIPLVPVTIIGTGDGSVPSTGTVAVTPRPSSPNLIITVVTPLMAISIRFANAYLTALVGLVLAGMTSNIIPANDFVSLVGRCATLSLAGPGVSLAKDLITVLGRLERKYPLATGSV